MLDYRRKLPYFQDFSMDLRELKGLSRIRHPWETSRVEALRSILKQSLDKDAKALDIGCGDGFVCMKLFKGTAVKRITAVDINLTKELIDELSKRGGGITYSDKLPKEKNCYGLILLLDVVEHVKDDGALLKEIGDYLEQGGRVLITAPAFNFLFSSHDRYLRHVRRYSLKELRSLVESSGLRCVSSGYLFASLLLPRLLSASLERLFKIKDGPQKGVGNWRFGRGITKAIELMLRADNKISLIANGFGLKLPGLTGWVLCERR
ncbi:MAG: class I SAM-dependent methyltransferase [Deltaproteobacteria bacterium]|nr:class I SAM-dependent methyltransferase [Deltaproteobacteria bacterium]